MGNPLAPNEATATAKRAKAALEMGESADSAASLDFLFQEERSQMRYVRCLAGTCWTSIMSAITCVIPAKMPFVLLDRAPKQNGYRAFLTGMGSGPRMRAPGGPTEKNH